MSNVLNMVSEQTFVAQTNAIKNAIDAIAGGGSGSDEFLLKPTGTVTVENGTFRVPYVGTEPQINTASIIIPNAPKGIVTNLISYNLQFSGGNAVFTASSATNNLSTAVDCVIQIGTGWHKVTIQNLPVAYQPEIEYFCELTFSKQGDEESTTLVADLANDVYPKNVSPLPAATSSLECILKDTNESAYVGYADITGTELVIDLSSFQQEIDIETIYEGWCWGNQRFKFSCRLAEAES